VLRDVLRVLTHHFNDGQVLPRSAGVRVRSAALRDVAKCRSLADLLSDEVRPGGVGGILPHMARCFKGK
jgi:hypothetical protein